MINGILEQLQATYTAHRWMRIAALPGLLIAGILLLLISGGFPPWAWRFLFQVMPQLPRLLQAHGLPIVFPLAALLLLSATLLFAWAAFVLACIRLARDWWREHQELQRFDEELLAAQYQSEMMQEDLDADPFSQGPVLAAAATPARASASSSPASTQFMGRERTRSRGNISVESEPDMRTYSRPALERQPHGKATTKSKGGIYLDIGTGLDAGIKRRGSPNEDSLLAIENITSSLTAPQPVGLFIIADGLGGHGNGREASQMAIRAVRESILMALRLGIEDDMLFTEILIEGVQNANRSVYKRNQQQHADMGTTLTAALLWGTTAYIANVGDSRTYVYRESGGLYQVTQDHSIVARLVERGAITADDVYTHPKRNEIYRSLGNHPTVEVDTFTMPLQADDVLLLCSDGLWEMVHDAEIEKILHASAPYSSQMCSMLVQAALNRGGKDNISVIAVCFREE